MHVSFSIQCSQNFLLLKLFATPHCSQVLCNTKILLEDKWLEDTKDGWLQRIVLNSHQGLWSLDYFLSWSCDKIVVDVFGYFLGHHHPCTNLTHERSHKDNFFMSCFWLHINTITCPCKSHTCIGILTFLSLWNTSITL